MTSQDRSYTNMEIRALLQSNANNIIKNNQIIAYGNCSNVLPIKDIKFFGTPFLYNNIMDNPISWDNPSDLKDSYLNEYKNISNKCAPHILYMHKPN